MALSMQTRTTMIRSRQTSVRCQAAHTPVHSFGIAAVTAATCAGLMAAPAFASVSFNVSDNAVVSSPVHLEFSVVGLTVKPAAEGVQPGTGHFHVLVDVPAPAAGETIPFDASRLHFGKGQTQADVELAPGKHTLTLQFADALHVSYGPEQASTITVEVK